MPEPQIPEARPLGFAVPDHTLHRIGRPIRRVHAFGKVPDRGLAGSGAHSVPELPAK